MVSRHEIFIQLYELYTTEYKPLLENECYLNLRYDSKSNTVFEKHNSKFLLRKSAHLIIVHIFSFVFY